MPNESPDGIHRSAAAWLPRRIQPHLLTPTSATCWSWHVLTPVPLHSHQDPGRIPEAHPILGGSCRSSRCPPPRRGMGCGYRRRRGAGNGASIR